MEHQHRHYTPIIGKEIYPVAINPMEDRNLFPSFLRMRYSNSRISIRARYVMIRGYKVE